MPPPSGQFSRHFQLIHSHQNVPSIRSSVRRPSRATTHSASGQVWHTLVHSVHSTLHTLYLNQSRLGGGGGVHQWSVNYALIKGLLFAPEKRDEKQVSSVKQQMQSALKLRQTNKQIKKNVLLKKLVTFLLFTNFHKKNCQLTIIFWSEILVNWAILMIKLVTKCNSKNRTM